MTNPPQLDPVYEKESRPSAFCVFLEPAPYMLALSEELANQWEGRLRVRFISGSLSQSWTDLPETALQNLLPRGPVGAIKLFRELFRDQPDVVFVAGWGHPTVLASIVVARLVGAKIVSMSDTHISRPSWLMDTIRRNVFKLIDAFVPGGSRQRQYLLDAGVESERVFVGSMTSDTAAISELQASVGAEQREEIRRELGIDENTPIFLYVGRLEIIKGLDLLLSAWTSHKRKGNGHLLILGDGSLRETVAQYAADHASITFPGRKQGTELWQHFFASDVLVLPSRKEPWGLVVNEALAANLPVVVSDAVGCIEDLVEPEKNGLIFLSEDIDELCSSLSRLASERDLRETLQKRALPTISGWTSRAWASNIVSAWSHTLNPGFRAKAK